MRRTHRSERDELELFRAQPGDLVSRDAQDLMAYPLFSLAKTKRIVPIDFRAGAISIRDEAVPEHGMATIRDADILIWAASQIVEGRDAGLKTSRLMTATPYESLTFVGRGTGARDYDRLKAGLDRFPIRNPVCESRSAGMNDLTQVEVFWLEKRIENRIRFGRAVEDRMIDRHRRVLSFAPGSIFALVRWTSNDFGTVISRIDILRAVAPGERCSTVPYVKPGGESLLRLSGSPKVERVLQLIDVVEGLGIDPADAAPDHWHHVHNRLSVNETPRAYTKGRHRAWLHRQRFVR
ncbi:MULTISPECIES: DUF2840 domain-containing protein [unclassified Bradyrhizobium]|uniref:DUF2840 domain-containing protein n=1 Tax=Bradyrhizobium sp. USDA 4541 TaxID=2817704 RepID=UPI0020A276EF|nr:DUF2840 domain-containing protein [Bradyrhizobium sp. USDA 4541]MCP1850586.1 hypothetical protein [Bradyrhizobium sp. USDA 4541]